MEIVRKIIFYKYYFDDFFSSLTESAKNKIDDVLFMISILEKIPPKFFKSIQGYKGLYEIRVEYESNIYRIFCCFNKGSLVVLFNGFQKKTRKTPNSELKKAQKIMLEYFKNLKEEQ